MATDGAEYTRRRSLYGKLYTEIKGGATSARVAEVAVQSLAKEIRRDCLMRVLAPISRALVALVVERPLFLGSEEGKRDLLGEIRRVSDEYREDAGTRFVAEAAREIIVRGELEDLSGAPPNTVVRRVDELLGHKLLESLCIVNLESYAQHHRPELEGANCKAFMDDVHAEANESLTRMIGSVRKNPSGKPGRWDSSGSDDFDHSERSLTNVILAEF